MTVPSILRLVGLVLSLAGLLFVWRRRSERMLERWELFLSLGLVMVALLALFPSLGNGLLYLTGFHGELGRITSVLSFAVLFLVIAQVQLQSQHAELRGKFFELTKRMAVEQALPSLPMDWKSTPPTIALLMPAFNEAENLAELLPRAPRQILGQPVSVIVVDDGSHDDTVSVARQCGVWVIQNPVNSGGGHALKVGFLAAQRLNIPFTVTMDADGQHRFEDLPALLTPLLNGGAEVVVGSRHLGESVGHEAVRAIGLRVFNAVLTFLVGWSVTDCSSGFRAFNMKAFSRLHLIQNRHHTAELIIEATRRGLSICEAPIVIVPRVHGESKKGTNLLYGLRFAHTIISSWWRQ